MSYDLDPSPRGGWLLDEPGPSPCEPQQAQPAAQRIEGGLGPVTRSLDTVSPRRVEWLWPGRVPLGKLSIIAGDPGLGKSMATLDIAATVSTGRPWPDGAANLPRSGVLLVSAEDELEDTVRPRLDAAGADCSRVTALEGIRDASGDEPAPFTFDRIDALTIALADRPDTRLVIIDPVSAFIPPKRDANNQAEMRGLLGPLARLAAAMGVSVLLVAHLNKTQGGKSAHRLSGSMALPAAARAVWMVAPDSDDPERRLMLPVKNNLARDRTGMAFTVDGDPPRVVWEPEPIEMTADEAAQREASGAERLREACEFIEELLVRGAVPSVELDRRAGERGIAPATLKRARRALGLKARKQSNGSESRWMIEMP